MTAPAFTVRDLTWRSLAAAQPEPGQACLVRTAGVEFGARAAFIPDRGAVWTLPLGGTITALPGDEWRAEDER